MLHVGKHPMFVEGTLLHNLTFGCAKGTQDHSLKRVLTICEKMGLPQHILNTIRDDKLECSWSTLLSLTECVQLHIARALIANPEVLCIHKPTLTFNDALKEQIYKVLKEFVLNRGLEMDPKSFYMRRPRTCIFSARN